MRCVLFCGVLLFWASAGDAPASAPRVPQREFLVQYGAEFWRAKTDVSASPDIGAAIERVRHAIAFHGSRGTVSSRSYQASFEGRVARISLARTARNGRSTSAAFDIEASSLRLDGRELIALEHPLLTGVGNTAQVCLNPEHGVTLHFEARAGGVQVTWILFEPLAGRLSVQLRIPAAESVSQAESGIRFRAIDTAAHLKIGAAMAVDAGGRVWPLRSTADGELWNVEVPSEILSQAAYPLAIDPLVSPEFDIDDPVITSDAANQYQPAIASNGREFLAVWSDTRTLTTDGFNIFATRVLSNGVPADPSGLVISRKRFDKYVPSVAASGRDFLVVWQQTVFAGSGVTSFDIYGARVSASGQVLDPGGIPICAVSNEQRSPVVCGTSNQWMVLWEDDRRGPNATDIYGTRVNQAGAVLDPIAIAVGVATNRQTSPGIASDGNDFFAVWEDRRNSDSFDIYGTRISSMGAVIDASGLPISRAAGAQRHPAVAFGGAGFLVVWEDDFNSAISGIDLVAARVSRAAVVSPAFFVSISDGNQKWPSLCALENNFVAVWADDRNGYDDIYGCRIAGNNVLDPLGLRICDDPHAQSSPKAAPLGDGCFIVWEDDRSREMSGIDIYGIRMFADGSVANPAVSLTTDVNEETTPDVAFDGRDYLVVWCDNRQFSSRGWDVYGARISGSGQLLDPNGITICSETNDQESAHVAAGNGGFLVAWSDHRASAEVFYRADIYAARVIDGRVMETNGFPVQTNLVTYEGSAMACNGADFLIAWRDYRSGGILASIYGNVVRSDGALLRTDAFPIGVGKYDRHSVAVASDGRDFLVVFADDRDYPPDEAIYAARVSGAGALLDPANFRITSAGRRPALASNGRNYLVTWSGPYDTPGARGALVFADGTVVSTNGFAISPTGVRPSAAPNGSDYLVAWSDSRNEAGGGGWDIFAARVMESGLVVDLNGFSVNTNRGDQIPVRMAAGLPGSFLLVSQGMSQGTQRAVANMVSLSETPVLRGIVCSPAHATIEWSAVPGARYRVEYKSAIGPGWWTGLPGEVLANAFTASRTDSNRASSARFYRVLKLP